MHAALVCCVKVSVECPVEEWPVWQAKPHVWCFQAPCLMWEPRVVQITTLKDFIGDVFRNTLESEQATRKWRSTPLYLGMVKNTGFRVTLLGFNVQCHYLLACVLRHHVSSCAFISSSVNWRQQAALSETDSPRQSSTVCCAVSWALHQEVTECAEDHYHPC